MSAAPDRLDSAHAEPAARGDDVSGERELLRILYPAGELPGFLTISCPDPAFVPSDAKNKAPMVTRWPRDAETAAHVAAELAPASNVYVGLGLRRARGTERQRGAAADVVAIPGVWAELDVAGGTHSTNGTGKHYFPTKADAQTFLDGLPMQPSVRVDSGGGLQGYWLFREPWVFEDDAERLDGAAVVEGWQRFLQRRAKALGFDIDSTFDLARVLRVAPSLNHKVSPPLPVTVTQSDGPRYNPSDFAEWAVPVGDGAPAATVSVTIRWDAEPPAKFEALLAADQRTRATWNRKRHDLTDQTPSAYCMALANAVVDAGWTDQEVADLLIAARRRYGANPKADGWYRRTIAKARERDGAATARAGSAATMAAPATTPVGHGEDCRCSQCVQAPSPLALLSKKLDLDIVGVVKRGRQGGSFELLLAGGVACPLGDAASVLRFSKVEAAIFDAIGKTLPAPLRTSKAWLEVAKMIASVAEILDLPTKEDQTVGWLQNFLAQTGTFASSLEDAVQNRFPYRDDLGWVFFQFDDLLTYVGSYPTRAQTSFRDLAERLSAVGAEPFNFQKRSGKERVRVKLWKWRP